MGRGGERGKTGVVGRLLVNEHLNTVNYVLKYANGALISAKNTIMNIAKNALPLAENARKHVVICLDKIQLEVCSKIPPILYRLVQY